MPNQTAFTLPYLKEQLKVISEKRPQYNVGNYYVSYNFNIEQHAFIELLLAECIKTMETKP